MWLPRLGHEGNFCLFLLDWSLWGKLVAMLWGHSSSPVETPMWQNWGLLPTASTTSHVTEPPWKWVLRPQSSLQIRQQLWLTSDHHLMRVVSQSPSQNPDSQKLQNITGYCCFKPQRFGVFCCSVIYNFYTGICNQWKYVLGRRNSKFKDTWHIQGIASRGWVIRGEIRRWGLWWDLGICILKKFLGGLRYCARFSRAWTT